MEILKHGKKNKGENKEYAIFTCQCGCEFEAQKDEYHEDSLLCTSISYPITHYVYANCPECHKMCCGTKKDEIENTTVVYSNNASSPYTQTIHKAPQTIGKTESSKCYSDSSHGCIVEFDENGMPKVDIQLNKGE